MKKIFIVAIVGFITVGLFPQNARAFSVMCTGNTTGGYDCDSYGSGLTVDSCCAYLASNNIGQCNQECGIMARPVISKEPLKPLIKDAVRPVTDGHYNPSSDEINSRQVEGLLEKGLINEEDSKLLESASKALGLGDATQISNIILSAEELGVLPPTAQEARRPCYVFLGAPGGGVFVEEIGDRTWLGCLLAGGTRTHIIDGTGGTGGNNESNENRFTSLDKNGEMIINEKELEAAESKLNDATKSMGGVQPEEARRPCYTVYLDSNGELQTGYVGMRTGVGCFLAGGSRQGMD